MALRPGFLIPNANTFAPDFKTAQPDQGDFLILGSSQTGVVTGCEVTLTGLNAGIGVSPHIVVIDGVVYLLQENTSVSLAATGAQARWDLIIYDTTDGFTVLPGTPSDDPVFPDISTGMVVLAAVYVPQAGSGTTPSLIDKRNFLPRTVVGDANASSVIRSYDGTSPVFNVDGAGAISWGTGTRLEKLSTGVLKITSEVQATTLTATVGATVAGEDVITAATIDWGPLSARPATPDIGMIWINTANGEVYAYTSTGWESVGSTSRVGDVKMSFLAPEDEDGWLPLIGQTLAVENAGGLPDKFPDWVSGGNITLPDFRGYLPVGAGSLGIGNPGTVNVNSGTRVNDHGTAQYTLTVNELPSHTHAGATTTGTAGDHTHTATVSTQAGSTVTSNPGGTHHHGIYAWSAFQEATYGIRNLGTANAAGTDTLTDSVTTTAPDHVHTVGIPSHSHTASISTANGHTHTLPAAVATGGGQAMMIQPPTLSIYFYIKY